MTPSSTAYLLVIRESTPEAYDALTPAQQRAALDEWNAWVDGMAARGKVQHGHPLKDDARIVSGARGRHVVDGPFAEAKEMVGGYFLLSVADLDEATALVQACPLLQYGMTIEIRPIAEACHLARAIGWQTMRHPGAV